ncbi:MAG: hypothetical protein Q9160_004611 [Pyrenula sp. 1 TL-2023]
MKAVLQRVTSASVTVDKQLISSIGKGILCFAAVGPDDSQKDADSMASRVVKLKMWPDPAGSGWKKSVKDVDGEILCVSQFTLYASTKKGNKPDFHGAARPEKGKELYDYFFSKVQELHGPEKVKNGVFQAMMDVSLVNDGPVGVDYQSRDGAVTIEIDTSPPKKDAKSDQGNTLNRRETKAHQEAPSSTNAAGSEQSTTDLPQELLN